MSIEIYGLYDPDTNELRYIGKANNAAKRLKTHILDRHQNRPVCRWVKSLVESGKVPSLVVLERVEASEWEAAERRLIAQYRQSSDLLNLADGGAMPSQTKEQRKTAAKASNEVQRNKSPEWKRFVKAKQDIGRLRARFLKTGDYFYAYLLLFQMRLDAARRPDLHASWLSL